MSQRPAGITVLAWICLLMGLLSAVGGPWTAANLLGSGFLVLLGIGFLYTHRAAWYGLFLWFGFSFVTLFLTALSGVELRSLLFPATVRLAVFGLLSSYLTKAEIRRVFFDKAEGNQAEDESPTAIPPGSPAGAPRSSDGASRPNLNAVPAGSAIVSTGKIIAAIVFGFLALMALALLILRVRG